MCANTQIKRPVGATMPEVSKETGMAKSQHGNKEAKKPKKAASDHKAGTPAIVVPTLATTVQDRLKKKK
jgi:hypothetical protein